MKLLLVVLLGFAVSACAMEMPRDEFLDSSELVVVLKLDSIAKWEEPATGMLLLSNRMLIEEVLKGNVASSTLVVKTYGNVTESPELEIGKRYVMFLQWSEEETAFLPVNGVQGCWEILSDDKLGGMGRGRSLDSLKAFFKKL